MPSGPLPAWNALLSAWDAWLLTVALAVVVPVLGYWRFRRLQIRADAALVTRNKLRFYFSIICRQWFLVAVMLMVVRRHGLSLSEIGERLGDARLTLGVIAAVLAILGVVFAIVRSRPSRPPAKAGPGPTDYTQALIPAFGWEMAAFALVSVTAGICEELLYRGWLVNFLRVATGSVWIAVGAGAAIFGMGHAYQGAKGMLRTGFIGLQLALLFVYMDSLVPGQVLHAGVDLVVGVLLATAARRLSGHSTAA